MGETNQVIWTTEGQLTLRISMRFTHVYRISETPRQLHTPPQQQVAPLAAAKKSGTCCIVDAGMFCVPSFSKQT